MPSFRFLLLVAVPLGLLLYLFFPTLQEIALICYNDEDYSHGLILPFVSAYVISEKRTLIRERLRRPVAGISIVGIVLICIGVLGAVCGKIAGLLYISWFAFFPAAAGLLMLLFGSYGAMPLVAPLLLLFMSKPIPDSLVPILFFPLQVFAARVSAAVLEMLDVPVYLVGNIIEIPGMRLMVEEACSGIRSMLALLSVAMIVMLLVPMKNWARVTIVVVSVLTAVGLNVFRVALTGVLAHFYDPSAATGFFHMFSGLVVFAAGLVIVYGVGSMLAIKERPANV